MGKKIRQAPEERAARLKAIGERLEEERTRLGMTQDRMAQQAQMTRRSYFDYESGEREIGGLMLADFMAIGIDILYVLTGIRQTTEFLPQELAIVEKSRLLPPQLRATHLHMMQMTIEAIMVAQSCEPSSDKVKSSSNTISGVGQYFEGNNHSSAPFTMHVAPHSACSTAAGGENEKSKSKNKGVYKK